MNAANDSNTDADRATIQKEFDQKMVNINDIASETNYNGKLLLNGDYYRPYTYWGQTYAVGNPQTTTVVVGQRLESVQIGTRREPRPGVRQSVPNTVQDISSAFKAGSNTGETTGGAYSWWNSNFSKCSKVFEYTVNINGLYTSPVMSAKMDFSGMSMPGGGAVNIPDDLDLQGFSILCGGCNAQFITINFDVNTTSSSCISGGSTGQSYVYTIGIKDISSVDELPKAIFDGIQSTSPQKTYTSF